MLNMTHDSHFISKIKNILCRPKNGSELFKEALEDYIEELDKTEDNPTIALHEKTLITNVLTLRTMTVHNVMIPRADIVAVGVNTSQKDLMALLANHQFSRIPIYNETLDDILGTIHIKDILSALASHGNISLKEMIRPVPIVSPALPVLDLLMKMKQDKKHMALVVDEHGGIDGLVTIGDVIESIVGEIDDEFDQDSPPQINKQTDGSLIADARLDINDFETECGALLNEEEKEEIDTLGGLVFDIANRIPARGEIITHSSGMVFEILEADQRRIHTIKIRNVPDVSQPAS